MRGFEKISFEQFKKDISDDIELYEEYYYQTEKPNVLQVMTFMQYIIIH